MDDTELDEVESQKNSVNLTIEIPELSTDIQELEKKVNSIFNNDVTSMLEKSKQLLEIKDDIKKEQDNINYMIDKISDLSPKKSKKLKNLTLDDLVSLFEKEEDINNKIKIYQNICYIIDKFKNKLFD
tara:strand:- start:3943 stop:4326 length:384 start_codon:yes stop_codon:yes gene_type:complete